MEGQSRRSTEVILSVSYMKKNITLTLLLVVPLPFLGAQCLVTSRVKDFNVSFESQESKSQFVGLSEYITGGATPRYFLRETLEGKKGEWLGRYYIDPTLAQLIMVRGGRTVYDPETGLVVESIVAENRDAREGCGGGSYAFYGNLIDDDFDQITATKKTIFTQSLTTVCEGETRSYPGGENIELTLQDEDTPEQALRYANSRKDALGWDSSYGVDIPGNENLAYANVRTGRIIEGQSAQFIVTAKDLCSGTYEINAKFSRSPIGGGSVDTIPRKYSETVSAEENGILEIKKDIPIKEGFNTSLASIQIRLKTQCDDSNTPGTEQPNMGSVDFAISLGSEGGFDGLGSLNIMSETLDASLGQAASLTAYLAESDTVESIAYADGTIRQILTSERLFDIANTSATSYAINMYDSSAVGAQIEDPAEAGLMVYDTSALGAPIIAYDVAYSDTTIPSLLITLEQISRLLLRILLKQVLLRRLEQTKCLLILNLSTK